MFMTLGRISGPRDAHGIGDISERVTQECTMYSQWFASDGRL